MKKILVNIYFPYKESDLIKLFPHQSCQWKNFEFVYNVEGEECDFCIIYTKHNLDAYHIVCNPKNVIFISGEPESVQNYSHLFLKQFGKVIGHRASKLKKGNVDSLEPLGWHSSKTFDELFKNDFKAKPKRISVISSNKYETPGHRLRYDFVLKIKNYFSDEIDLFGRGINDFNDKSEAIEPYQFSLAIENSVYPHYISEKLFDCTLEHTFPIYYGAPNAYSYVNAIKLINIHNFERSIKTIEQILNDELLYERMLPEILKDKHNYLLNYSPIPCIVRELENMDPFLKKKPLVIKNTFIERIYWFFKSNFKNN